MNANYDFVYLSPHLDDAALSCGGQIFQQTGNGARVLILTIMAGPPPPGEFSPFARELHERWELPEAATVVRRREDAAACAVLGVDFRHWEIPDAVYRRDHQTDAVIYPSWSDVISGIAPVERPLINHLARRMASFHTAGKIICPLGVGNHVDHLVVRAAAEQAFSTLVYYEDLPYAHAGRGVLELLKSDAAEWIPESVPLTRPALLAKARAIRAYRSQLSTFFTDGADLRAQLEQHGTAVGGERRWHRISPGE